MLRVNYRSLIAFHDHKGGHERVSNPSLDEMLDDVMSRLTPFEIATKLDSSKSRHEVRLYLRYLAPLGLDSEIVNEVEVELLGIKSNYNLTVELQNYLNSKGNGKDK